MKLVTQQQSTVPGIQVQPEIIQQKLEVFATESGDPSEASRPGETLPAAQPDTATESETAEATVSETFQIHNTDITMV